MANCLFCGDWDCCCGGTSGSSSGGGTGYTLPTASTTKKGGIKVGEGLEMNGDTLNVTLEGDYSLPTASSTRKGGIKVRNGDDGLKMEGEYLTVTLTGGSDYSLKPATTSRLGGIMVGDGLEIDGNGVLSCSLSLESGSVTAEDTSESEFNRFVFGEG